jgi:hypothetical protein
MPRENIPSSAETPVLEGRHWRSLLRDIHAGQVVPVIGPELVMIARADGRQVPLCCYLAEELAQRLGVALGSDTQPTLNDVACAWLLSGQSSKGIYDELRELVDQISIPPPQPLLDLASITDFGVYISSTFDPLLSQALQQMRPGFLPNSSSLDFHPNAPRDLPQPLPNPFLYHILGTHNTYPDFVVWEEDYIEYVCGLLRSQDNLRVLFDLLRNKDLLLIGAPFNDWIVRLFLRVAKGKRFSEARDQGRQDYVADEPAGVGKPTIFFYERQVGSTRIIPGDPRAFAGELARHWRERYASATQGDFLQRMGDELPRGAVFISYSRDDLSAATELARGLMAAQVPVWMDKGRLSAGENYQRSLEHAVKTDASFFISLISKATESDPDRYVHQERAWAAQRQVDGFVYYLPVLIEDLSRVEREPPAFARLHRELLPGGRVSTAFTQRMRNLVQEHRTSGQPRG